MIGTILVIFLVVGVVIGGLLIYRNYQERAEAMASVLRALAASSAVSEEVKKIVNEVRK